MKKRKIEIYGLRQRWLINSLSPIFVVVLLVAVTFCVGMTNYYYNSMRDGLKTRAAHASDYFTSYSMNSYAEFYQSAYNFTKEFAERDYLEVQFIGESGKIIISSYGLTSGLSPGTSDITDALQGGEMGYYRGIDPSTGEHIMAVSAPLQFNGRVRGALRYVTAMSAAEGEILVTIGVAAMMLLLCVGMVYFSNMVFINNVVAPLAEITGIAKRIAGGSYGTQMENEHQDEIGQLIDAINDMSAKISLGEKMKTEFISSVSHELRTPLTAITGWSETLAYDETISEESQRGIGIIAKESARLTKMVEELLEFTRIQDGRFNLNLEALDVAGELEDAIFTYGKLLAQEGVTVDYTPPAKDIPLILGDPERLKQVFLNIMDNAAKYGRAGGRIVVTIGATESWVVIRFRDYGPGIPENELPFVKKKFYKGSGKERGSGIGLSVCDEIIGRHKGRLELENAKDDRTGLIATVMLPVINEEELTIG